MLADIGSRDQSATKEQCAGLGPAVQNNATVFHKTRMVCMLD